MTAPSFQPRYFVTVILWMVGIAWALASQALAQSKPGVPPPVVEREVTVERGKQVVIPLGIHGGRGEDLEFLIRAKPSKGRLSKVKKTGLTTAAILYTPPDDETVSSEQFTYAVRGRDGVSAPGVVKIAITEPPVIPPELSVTEEALDFGSIPLGKSGSRVLEVKNSGGGVAEGAMIVPEPWRVEGEAGYSIKAGESTSFTISFHPDKAGTFRGVIEFNSDSKVEVRLIGEAYQPFTVTPGFLEMAAQPGKQTRGGSLQIVNQTDIALSLKVEAPASLLTNESMNVQPRGSAELVVFADPSNGGQMDEEITITGAGWKTNVKVRAFSVGTLVRFTQSALEFETVEVGKAATLDAMLENPGSEKAYIRFKVDPPFEAQPEKLELPPGGNGSVKIKFLPDREGEFSKTLQADNNGQIAQVSIKAVAMAAKVPVALKSSDGKSKTVTMAAAQSDDLKPGVQKPDPVFSIPQTRGDIVNFKGIVLMELSQTHAVFEWPSDWGATSGIELQLRTLGLDAEGKLAVNWSNFPGVEFENQGEKMRAKVSGLEPKSPYAFRVIPKDRKSGEGAICTTRFTTKAVKPWFNISGFALTLTGLSIALVVALWQLWKRRQQSGW